MAASFEISARPIEPDALKAALAADQAGACVCFEGWVRNHNEGEPVLAEALERFAIVRARCVHRTGRLEIGDCAVWVGVSAAHRGAAFDACRYIIDEIKHRLPIWKKEHYSSGESGWVNCARPERDGAALPSS